MCRSCSRVEPHYIDYIIRPRDAYPGGNYGDYGGWVRELEGGRRRCRRDRPHEKCMQHLVPAPAVGGFFARMRIDDCSLVVYFCYSAESGLKVATMMYQMIIA